MKPKSGRKRVVLGTGYLWFFDTDTIGLKSIKNGYGVAKDLKNYGKIGADKKIRLIAEILKEEA